ncbi:MAG: metallophosphoesterase [Thiolinea sp.]
MPLITHISDLHFGRDLPTVTEGLLDCLDTIRPELIIISGDLTQRAKHREFAQAADFLSSLNQPYMIIPGNHDIALHRLPERFFYPWDKWRKYIGSNLEPVLHREDFTAVGINTARRMGLHPDWSRGRINRLQINRARQVFTQTPPQRLRILVAHHPFWLPQSSLNRSLVGRCNTALRAFREIEVDLILGGHIHLAYVEPVSGMIISHAGTTISHRLIDGQPNSFNLIRGDRQQLKIEQWEWHDHAFRPCSQHTFHRTERGWQQR